MRRQIVRFRGFLTVLTGARGALHRPRSAVRLLLLSVPLLSRCRVRKLNPRIPLVGEVGHLLLVCLRAPLRPRVRPRRPAIPTRGAASVVHAAVAEAAVGPTVVVRAKVA